MTSLRPPAPGDLADALRAVAAAVALVTVADGRDDVGVTVSTLCPVSTDPPLVSVALQGGTYPAELLRRVDGFAVTVLAAGQRAVAGRFAAAGRPGARRLLEGESPERGPRSGALIAAGGLAGLDCVIWKRVEAGDHLLVVAEVAGVAYVAEAGQPLLRFRGRYPALAS
ncbi:MAG TPA: flavin reductase family protein [Streptosporangiaceae bacterium]